MEGCKGLRAATTAVDLRKHVTAKQETIENTAAPGIPQPVTPDLETGQRFRMVQCLAAVGVAVPLAG